MTSRRQQNVLRPLTCRVKSFIPAFYNLIALGRSLTWFVGAEPQRIPGKRNRRPWECLRHHLQQRRRRRQGPGVELEPVDEVCPSVVVVDAAAVVAADEFAEQLQPQSAVAVVTRTPSGAAVAAREVDARVVRREVAALDEP